MAVNSLRVKTNKKEKAFAVDFKCIWVWPIADSKVDYSNSKYKNLIVKKACKNNIIRLIIYSSNIPYGTKISIELNDQDCTIDDKLVSYDDITFLNRNGKNLKAYNGKNIATIDVKVNEEWLKEDYFSNEIELYAYIKSIKFKTSKKVNQKTVHTIEKKDRNIKLNDSIVKLKKSYSEDLPSKPILDGVAFITSGYFRSQTVSFHGGLDIGASEGTEIRAVYDGIVVKNGFFESPGGGYGNYVIVLLTSGKYFGEFMLYGHMRDRSTLKPYEKINKMDLIGRVGGTGKVPPYGRHLHLEIRRFFSFSKSITQDIGENINEFNKVFKYKLNIPQTRNKHTGPHKGEMRNEILERDYIPPSSWNTLYPNG